MIQATENTGIRPLQAGPFTLPIDRRTVVMGILNVTPDSFSDGGKHHQLEQALRHAQQMVADGAEIIDVGGESTRPGYDPVSLEEELTRVVPVVRELSRKVHVPISVDTYKAEVARQAVEAGAHMINDVWGFKKDPDMARVAAELDVPVVLMHNRLDARYHSLMDEVESDLMESVTLAREAGVKDERIILDPGIGFAKTHEENLIVMRNLERIVALGFPVLLGTSRKSIIGRTLDLPVEERVEGTGATVALGISKGCCIVRVHDVKEMVRVSRMTDAMVNAAGGV
ncbi:MAG: dihydropteroate synthase [Firmicutes bacterium]|uniref:Dihydropteroate synthase n=1 Tax=Melghirimyces thermohalophilus TaxID=1236220 RepID=A0A1G6Q387_9BACL|nr:dihydropteroate synthase [Melghirimyces thermohalophilus]MDA8352113.1 dihydropteroate synthase [Bacillota bacterium]SDC86711.1 Dihydropteroate synthase [Melghirimyces thermohalophilus]